MCNSAIKDAAEEKTLGRIHSFESFGSVDGPGVRFVVFLHGCAMRCKYCHNPDTWNGSPEYLMTAEEVFHRAIRYAPYWKKGGGITVSGGEPLLQSKFLIELFTLAKARGVSTAIDTSGQPFSKEKEEEFAKLLSLTDLVILDLKEMNEEKHRSLTGQPNENILKFASFVSESGVKLWIRHVLVPNLTDGEEELKELSQFVSTLKTVERTEILPYHTFGEYKWEKLQIPYPLKGVLPPTKEQVARAEELLGIKK